MPEDLPPGLEGATVRQGLGVYRLVARERIPTAQRCCSFCGHSMKVTGKLFRSRIDRERYICSRCVHSSDDLLAQKTRDNFLARLVRLLRRISSSKLTDLSGSDQQLT